MLGSKASGRVWDALRRPTPDFSRAVAKRRARLPTERDVVLHGVAPHRCRWHDAGRDQLQERVDILFRDVWCGTRALKARHTSSRESTCRCDASSTPRKRTIRSLMILSRWSYSSAQSALGNTLRSSCVPAAFSRRLRETVSPDTRPSTTGVVRVDEELEPWRITAVAACPHTFDPVTAAEGDAVRVQLALTVLRHDDSVGARSLRCAVSSART